MVIETKALVCVCWGECTGAKLYMSRKKSCKEDMVREDHAKERERKTVDRCQHSYSIRHCKSL